MTVPVLTLVNVSVEYAGGREPRAVNSVSLDLHAGRTVGLVGESGSGKSTVGKAILQLLPRGALVSGQILFEGRDLLRLSEAEMQRVSGRRIATVLQNPLTSLNPVLRIGDQVAEVFQIHGGLSVHQARSQAIAMLDKVGIPHPSERAQSFPHQLSGGMLQRVLIATALACNPSVLILDEPTTALDVTVEAEILQLVRRLNDEYQSAVLLITHDLRVVREMCDSVAIMYAGQVVEQAPVDVLFQRPLHPYTKGLRAAIPSLSEGKSGRRLSAVTGKLPEERVNGCVFHPRCPFAMDQCRNEQPPLSQANARLYRCWRAEELQDTPWHTTKTTGDCATSNGKAGDRAVILAVDNLRKRYATARSLLSPVVATRKPEILAVDDVSLRVHDGETVSLVGESGCGKSTVARCLIGLTPPSGGTIRFRGIDLRALNKGQRRAYQRLIQIVFQDPDSSLNPRRRVGEIIGRPLALNHLARGSRASNRVSELLCSVQLSPEYAQRFPHELSGGEKQRVAIARALAADPQLVILDEPVTALDVSVQASVLNLLVDLQRRVGLSYLFIAHDLSVVRYISDLVAVMYRGQICEFGTVEQVFSAPFHPYTALLLHSIPAPDFQSRKKPPPGFPADQPELVSGCRFFHRCPKRIPGLCDRAFPESKSASVGHRIFCHADLGELYESDPPSTELPATSRVRKVNHVPT